MSRQKLVIPLLFIIFIITSSCSDHITQPDEPSYPETTTFIPFKQHNSVKGHAKKSGQQSIDTSSKFGCSLSTLNEEGATQTYRYQAFYIQFPRDVMKQAQGKVANHTFALQSDRAKKRTPDFLNRDGIVRYLSCKIPDAPKAVEILEKEMEKFGTTSWYNDVSSTDAAPSGKNKTPDRQTTGVDFVCSYVPGDAYGNTSSTITVGGTTYTTYYFHEECEFVYSDSEPEDEKFTDHFGGSGGGGSDVVSNPDNDPDPCSTVIGSENHLSYPSDETVGCSAGLPKSVLSLAPKVQYPDGSNYAQDYPKLTEYLRNKLPTLKDNETIINAIEKYGDLSVDDIKDDLQWGEGPIIKIKQLDKLCGENCYGYFSGLNPNSLSIDIDLVNDLENTTIGSSLADSFSFLVGVTILHEYVHFSEWRDESWNSPESGILFEKDVYGQTVWRDNASLILKAN
ncbi:hypothetical protein [Fodinibius halophilus]|uniref:Tox-MPTase3 domain-containing protein n=1 Tax=Fodinibius halophilus TaxID=1736908 RepID=A0A6M1T020_9BACT|nr:hypothetical protein [Fodinibius halophilus]NGP87297.1 hypothetical protein [Fodinibius halophilus]